MGIILLLGAVFRFYELGNESYWIDEISTVYEAQQSVTQIITSGRLDQPLAYYLPFHYWIQIFGTSETGTRVFSALFGIGTIALVYMIGRELFSREIGLLGALMAVSWSQIYYSQIARYYVFAEFFSLLSFLFLILALKRKKSQYFVYYGIVSVLMLYSHSFSVFVLAAQNLFFLLYWRKNKQFIYTWITCQVLIVAAFIPTLYILLKNGGISGTAASTIGSWINEPTIKDLIRTIYNYLFPQNYQHDWSFILISFGAGFLLFLLGGLLNSNKKQKNQGSTGLKSWLLSSINFSHINSEFILVILWFVFPVLLPFIYSKIFSPIFLERYTIFAAPAFFLLISMAIFAIRRFVPVYITLCAMMVVVLPGLYDYYSSDVNEQWQETAAYVQEYSKAGDVVVFAPDQNDVQHKNFEWYYRGSVPACGISTQVLDEGAFSDAITNCASGYNRYWVVIRGTPDTEIYNRFTKFILSPIGYESELIDQHDFVGISTFLFELKN